jgi:repressor of nif and glnA expression
MYMQLTDSQPCTLYTGISKEKLIESVYILIKNDYGGKATAKRLEDKMDDIGKRKIRYAIKHLTKEGKIKRVRGFGPKGVQYHYVIV